MIRCVKLSIDIPSNLTVDEAVSLCSKNGLVLYHLSDELKDNMDVVISAVSQNKHALQHASSRLRQNYSIISTALYYTSVPRMLERDYVSYPNNPINHCGCITNSDFTGPLAHIPQTMFYNYNFLMEILSNPCDKYDSTIIAEYIPEEMKTRDIAIASIKQNVSSLQYFPQFQDDIDIILEAINIDCFAALYHASPSLKDNIHVVRKALDKDVTSLMYASDNLKNNFDIAMEVVQKKGRALEYVSDDLRNNFDIVIVAVKNYDIAIYYASPELQKNKDIIYAAIKQNASAFSYIPYKMRNDIEFIIECALINPDILFYIERKYFTNDTICNIGVKNNGLLLQYISVMNPQIMDFKFNFMACYSNIGALKYTTHTFQSTIQIICNIYLIIKLTKCFLFGKYIPVPELKQIITSYLGIPNNQEWLLSDYYDNPFIIDGACWEQLKQIKINLFKKN